MPPDFPEQVLKRLIFHNKDNNNTEPNIYYGRRSIMNRFATGFIIGNIIGMTSMLTTVEKYKGHMEWKCKDYCFSLVLLFPMARD